MKAERTAANMEDITKYQTEATDLNNTITELKITRNVQARWSRRKADRAIEHTQMDQQKGKRILKTEDNLQGL